jgi:hypothetical protein
MRDPIIPQAEQAERAVLGCLLFQPQTAWSTVIQTGLTGTDFHNPQFRAIFDGIKGAAEEGVSLEAIGLFHRLAGQSIPFHLLSELAGGFPSLEPLPEWCRLVQDASRRRDLLTRLTQATKAISEGQHTGEIVRGLGEAVTIASAEQGLGSIVQSTFNELLNYDTECDRNNLIGNRWICKGGSVLINAQSGIGKSSLTMQLAIGWAMPRDTPERTVFVDLLTFGIIPVKPLKSLILQAENDIGDQSEILQSVISKYGKYHCDEAVRNDLNDRLIFYRDNIHSGAEFLRVLEALVIKHQPDIAWIDPLMCYVGDDISDQKVVTEFCNGLNRISSKTGVVMALIHHLPKPREGAARTDSDLAYAGFGSSALTNWAREVVTLQRVETPAGDPPTCSLTMTKRRLRAGLICWDTSKPASRIHIRHSNEPEKHGMIWQPCRKPVLDEEEEKPKRKK